MIVRIWKIAICLLALGICPAGAQDAYPTRPVKIVVPFGAGAINDTVARLIAAELQKAFTEGVLVENRPGAGGMTGTDFVAKSQPDGYTLLIGTDDALSVLPAVKPVPYEFGKNLTPLFGFAATSFALAVRSSIPIHSFDDFLRFAKSNPGEIKYASTGAGGIVHVGTALLEDLTKIRLAHVPYPGMARAVTDVVGGHVDIVLVSPATIAPHFQSGKVRVLALADEKRNPDLRDVPTGAEVGLPGFVVRGTIGIVSPSGLPASTATRIESELAKIANSESFQKRLLELGITPSPLSAEDYRKRVLAESERWSGLAKRVDLQMEK